MAGARVGERQRARRQTSAQRAKSNGARESGGEQGSTRARKERNRTEKWQSESKTRRHVATHGWQTAASPPHTHTSARAHTHIHINVLSLSLSFSLYVLFIFLVGLPLCHAHTLTRVWTRCVMLEFTYECAARGSTWKRDTWKPSQHASTHTPFNCVCVCINCLRPWSMAGFDWIGGVRVQASM